MNFLASIGKLFIVILIGVVAAAAPIGTKSDVALSLIAVASLASFFTLDRILDAVRERNQP